jgi:Mrp family chromosome partitioning ATPase
MAQKVPIAGAVSVPTPQNIAHLDARKELNMFKKAAGADAQCRASPRIIIQ